MAYNFSLKEYANGTIQLTYYDYPVLDKFDKDMGKFKRGSYDGYEPDLSFLDDEEYSPWGDSLDDVSRLYFDDIKAQEDIMELSEDELKKRKERSLKSSLNRSIHKIYDIGRNNVWEWFFTFTLNEDAVFDRTDYVECAKKVCKWFNNIRIRLCPDIKYLIVPERHPTSGAWHFHALVSNVDNLEFKVAINNQEFLKDENGNIKMNKKGQPKRNKYFGQELRVSYPDGNFIYNIVNYNETRYGFSTATKITDTRKAVSYIVKYLTKELGECTFGKKRYFQSTNLILPQTTLFLQEKSTLGEVIYFVEQSFGVSVCPDYIKSVVVRQPNYKNTISYIEFQ